jgi:hypothetical protein
MLCLYELGTHLLVVLECKGLLTSIILTLFQEGHVLLIDGGVLILNEGVVLIPNLLGLRNVSLRGRWLL